jgi:hypothetical protein
MPRFCFLLFFLVLIAFIVNINFRLLIKSCASPTPSRLINQTWDSRPDLIDFEGFDNQNGTPAPIVPNIVHLLYFDVRVIKFTLAINIFSIYLHHRPDFIYIHCEVCSFEGAYWTEMNSIPDLKSRLVIQRIDSKPTIFGKNLTNFFGTKYYHRSDVWRLLILMNYGGIFLDNDVYVVNSLNKYRFYEMALSFETNRTDSAIGNQVLFAHRNARLLKAHFDVYRRAYNATSWFYNAGI